MGFQFYELLYFVFRATLQLLENAVILIPIQLVYVAINVLKNFNETLVKRETILVFVEKIGNLRQNRCTTCIHIQLKMH